MIYIKTKLNEDVEIKVDLYGDEFHSCCPNCGKEHDVLLEDIADIVKNGGDLGGTSIFCSECSKVISDES